MISSLFKWSWTKFIILLVVIVGVIVIGIVIVKARTQSYQFVTVTQGSINETVSVTGNTTPVSSVSLGFGNSGTISKVFSSVGKNVTQGQVLAMLNTSDLNAQIQQSQASVDAQEAQLQGLQAGARPEQIALDQQKYNDASSALLLAMNTAYVQTQDAVLNKTDTLFTGGNSDNPVINIYTQDQGRTIGRERLVLRDTLTQWKSAIDAGDPAAAGQATDNALSSVNSFINDLNTIVANAITAGMTQSQANSINATLASASQEISTAASNEQTAETSWGVARDTLALDKAGSTPQSIQAQQASVESAQAGVQSAEAKLQNSEIVAPISGVITQFDAKVGQFATPGTSLVSIISNGSFEIDALVSETDVGKIAVGNKVAMTLDAFPGETFTGSVFYIDPAQTSSEGVVGYKIKVSFDKSDPRIKSGLTVNLVINTRSKDDVLILPQYAILQNDDGTFVEVLDNKTVKNVPVTLGLQDQSGNVEIVSGVTAGEQVINIGLKQK